MKILQRNQNKRWVEISKKFYENEAELQDLLSDDVSILPLDEIGYDSPFVTIGKEVGLNNGSLDLLAVSTKGHILIIETKLDKNPEVKRTVVGQILGYASYIWNKEYEDLEAFFRNFLKYKKINYTGSLVDYVKEKSEDDSFSEIEFRQGIEKRLQLGSFSLLIVVDQANTELKDIANYLNDRTGQEIDFYVIEVEIIGDKNQTFLIPRLANPPRKNISSVSTAVSSMGKDPYDRTSLSREVFMTKLSAEGKKLAEKLFAVFEGDEDYEINWRKTGFSVSSSIPKSITTKFNNTYSYFFFHVGTAENPSSNYLYFYYPDESYLYFPLLRPIVEKYRQFYQSLPGYDDKRNVKDLSIFDENRTKELINHIKQISNSLKPSLNT